MNNIYKTNHIKGNVDRILFHNKENGFAILSVNLDDSDKTKAVVLGTMYTLYVGESIEATGEWVKHKSYGMQFKASEIQVIMPASQEAILQYLSSGAIKGIGPTYAKKIIDAFQDKVFEVLENSPEELAAIPGIGKMRAEKIVQSWQEQKVIKDIAVFLHAHGMTHISKAIKIFKAYGKQSVDIIRSNPYKMIFDIKGIGFISADQIALNLGVSPKSMIRARAGINYTLTINVMQGNCGLPKNILISQAEQVLAIPQDILIHAMNEEVNSGNIVMDENQVIFLANYYQYEKYIATKITAIIGSPWISEDNCENEAQLEKILSSLEITLAPKQTEAIDMVLKSKFSVITGGPGTGKTTILKTIAQFFTQRGLRVKLCAPTGRAAKRLSETTNIPAYTIHKLIKYHEDFDVKVELKCDVLIVDESSMIDVMLMYKLMKAIEVNVKVIIVGDVDQLPSIGAGQILRDIIESKRAPTVRLNHVFRQDQQSLIISNAHLVNQGIMPVLNNPSQEFVFVQIDEPEQITNYIRDLYVKYQQQGVNNKTLKENFQILSPMQKGGCGVKILNTELQKIFNADNNEMIERFDNSYFVGDKVMQIENNYDKEVYNGDIGYIKSINKVDQELIIAFDSVEVKYTFDELDQIVLAYAMTIHKSQGSEYKMVILTLATYSFVMLKKNLLYTAITRAKQSIIIIGSKKAIAIAVNNHTADLRHTKLKDWLTKKELD